MNKIFLKGRLTSTPELRKTPADKSVADFSIAVNRRFNREQTDFINCQAWGATGEFVAKHFDKGQEICVIGELHIDKWQKDGVTQYGAKVNVDEVYFCGSKAEKGNPVAVAPATNEDADGDLPF